MIAPSRFVPNASGASVVAENRFAKMILAAKIGRKLIAMAITARGTTPKDSSHQPGTSQLNASPPTSTPYMTTSGGVANRCVTSTAASTASSTPPNTSELTTQ